MLLPTDCHIFLSRRNQLIHALNKCAIKVLGALSLSEMHVSAQTYSYCSSKDIIIRRMTGAVLLLYHHRNYQHTTELIALKTMFVLTYRVSAFNFVSSRVSPGVYS